MIPATPLTGPRLESAMGDFRRVLAVADANPRTTTELAALCKLTPAKVQQAIQRNENRFERVSVRPNPKHTRTIYAYRIKI